MRMRFLLAVMTACGLCTFLLAAPKAETDTARRLDEAADVFSEIMKTPDKDIPQDLLEKAQCIVIVPGMKKGAFIVGANYGKGFLSCRKAADGGWSAPAAVRMEGGSFGFQIGGSETDVVLLVMNREGERKLLSSKFTLGADAEVAAGPVGRSTTAQTDAKMGAKILSWSRSHGVFAGIALKGATLRPDLDDNAELYGRKLSNREIVEHGVKPPEDASRLMALLDRYSPKKGEES
jgi:SH3 domain-containing YSC84-like protein 1